MEDLEVRVIDSSFVAPSEPTPRKGLWLSSLDLLLANTGHTPTFYLFHHNDAASDFFDVARLKAAMARVLVPFYPLAGRLGVDSSGRMEIDCNSEGALFVVARADITIDEIKDVKPSPELRRQLVPRIEPSSVVMAVQVSSFNFSKINYRFHASLLSPHHQFAFGTYVYDVCVGDVLQVWRGGVRDGAPPRLHRRHERVPLLPDLVGLLQGWRPRCHGARAPLPRPHPPPRAVSAHRPPGRSLDVPPELTFSDPLGPITTEVFPISKDQVASLKRLCGGASTFCAVSALVWRCACVARQLPPDAEALLTFSANIWRRVTLPLPDRYFGNALIRAGVAAAARDIVASEASLASVAGCIRAAVGRVDDEMVRSAIDYYETAEMGGRSAAKGTLPETELNVTSWLGMPMYDADFGWGKPWVMSRAESNRGGFVHLMSDGPTQGGGVRVLICMEAANVKEMERLLYEALVRC